MRTPAPKTVLLVIGALAVLPMAYAANAEARQALNYNFVEVSYVRTEVEGDFDGDGVGVVGSLDIGRDFFATGTYTEIDFGRGIETENWSLGIGRHWAVSEAMDIVATASYVDAEAESRTTEVGEQAWAVAVGIRGQAYENWEVEAGVNYVDADLTGGTFGASLAARYFLHPSFSIGGDLFTTDETHGFSISLRYTPMIEGSAFAPRGRAN